MRKWTRTAGIAAIAVAAMAGGASAQEPDSLELIIMAAARGNAGDHLGAIELYEQAYRAEPDLDVLVAIGAEYRDAGKPDEAIQNYCTYLTLEPRGEHAPFAASEVASLQATLGKQINVANVCAPGTPSSPIEEPTVRVAPPVMNASLSHREIAGLGAAALGLVSVGLGTYYGIRARAISDELAGHDPSQPWPADVGASEHRGQRAETLQQLYLVTGAIALATGGYLYVTGRSQRLSSERISITPSVSHGGATFSVSGGF